MLSDDEIQSLISIPKTIKTRTPARGYKEEGGHKRCDLELEASFDNGAKFTVFIRQSSEFIENYSLGLRYQTNDRTLGTITLVRYNGPHGEYSLPQDGHFASPHIHRITAKEIASGTTQPQESQREITKKYGTYGEALAVFFGDIGVTDYEKYFAESLQTGLFNGYS